MAATKTTKLNAEAKDTIKVYADLLDVKRAALRKAIDSGDAVGVTLNAQVIASVSRWMREAAK